MKWEPFSGRKFSGFRCDLVPLYEDQALISAQVYTCEGMERYTDTGVAWRWNVSPCVGEHQLHEAATSEEGMAAAEQQIRELIQKLVEQAG